MNIELIGIYKIHSEEPCNLIELEIKGPSREFEIENITQEILDEPIDNWQVPYDEHYLSRDGQDILNRKHPDELPESESFRVVFYFHYLDLSKPLKTQIGDIDLVKESITPDRLSFLKYVSP